MKTISSELPVFVFFDKEGSVISYRHAEPDTLYKLSLKEFEDVTQSFTPAIPNSFFENPVKYVFPISVVLDDEETICHIELGPIDNVYGKTHEQLTDLFS